MVDDGRLEGAEDGAGEPARSVVHRGTTLTLLRAREADDEAVLAFLMRIFRRPEYDLEWFRRVRYGSPVGERAYYVARAESGELTGVYGLAPVPVRVAGRRMMASECCNVAVHPLFWGTGLFQDLSRFALGEDARLGRGYAFCSPRRALAVKAHRDVGWTTLFDLDAFRRPAPAEPGADLPGFERVEDFPDGVDALWAEGPEAPDLTVVKDRAYLAWRYRAGCYRRYVRRNGEGEVVGVLVLKDYVDPASGSRRTHVMEAVGRGQEAALLDQACAVAAPGKELHTWCDERGVLAPFLRDASFERVGPMCPFLVHPHTSEAGDLLRASVRRYIALGDDEAF